ncbi:hypothetical protein M3765_21540 [Streptomyces thermoviolaceus]|uniref:hypothetical protein n=1 Tax=Streptomyces thermoviolaceus TaxID=1952 RepID=UPI00203D62FF|nr:hypothetical protein [Streptomyces thermoviolaceus]MCM3266550.1 hypothetical protein [Streptomyces thermoviolaceus]
MPDMSASASLAMTQLVTLADVDKNKVTPGILGFIVFAVLAVAVWGLMKSMNRHMGRIDFKEPSESEADRAKRSGDAARQPSQG